MGEGHPRLSTPPSPVNGIASRALEKGHRCVQQSVQCEGKTRGLFDRGGATAENAPPRVGPEEERSIQTSFSALDKKYLWCTVFPLSFRIISPAGPLQGGKKPIVRSAPLPTSCNSQPAAFLLLSPPLSCLSCSPAGSPPPPYCKSQISLQAIRFQLSANQFSVNQIAAN